MWFKCYRFVTDFRSIVEFYFVISFVKYINCIVIVCVCYFFFVGASMFVACLTAQHGFPRNHVKWFCGKSLVAKYLCVAFHAIHFNDRQPSEQSFFITFGIIYLLRTIRFDLRASVIDWPEREKKRLFCWVLFQSFFPALFRSKIHLSSSGCSLKWSLWHIKSINRTKRTKKKLNAFIRLYVASFLIWFSRPRIGFVTWYDRRRWSIITLSVANVSSERILTTWISFEREIELTLFFSSLFLVSAAC